MRPAEALGESEGALTCPADASHVRLSQGRQKEMRRVFLQLVRPKEKAPRSPAGTKSQPTGANGAAG